MKNGSIPFKTTTGFDIIKIECKWLNGEHRDEVLTFDNLKSFSYSGNATSSGSLHFGLASISSVSFSILNTSREWDGVSFKNVEFILRFGKALESGDEFVKVGKFWVEESVPRSGVINIQAYDAMAKFDVKFKGAVFPCTLLELVTQACSQVGIRLATTSFTNANHVVTTLENTSSLTCREVISLACELAGSFAIINSEEELVIKWFDTRNVDYVIPDEALMLCSPSDTPPPSGISIYFNDEELVAGYNDNPVTLSDGNKLLTESTVDECLRLISSIYDRHILLMNYTPGSIEASGCGLVEVGDVVQFSFEGKTYKFIVSTIKFSGNFKMTIESTAPKAASGLSGGSFTPGGSSNNNSAARTVFALSYKDAAISSNWQSVELVTTNLSLSSGHTPFITFTTSFLLSSSSDHVQLSFDLKVGLTVLKSFKQVFSKGYNTFTFAWPLVGFPTGQTKVSVLASAEGSGTWSCRWLAEDTAIVINGQGFRSSGAWNGLIEAVDWISDVGVFGESNTGVRASQINEGGINARATMTNKSTISDVVVGIEVGSNENTNVTIKGITEVPTINQGG